MVQRAKTYRNLHIEPTFFEYTVIMYLFIQFFIKIHLYNSVSKVSFILFTR